MNAKKIITRIFLLTSLWFGYSGAAVIGVSMPDTSFSVGDTVLVPVYTDSTLSGHNVLAMQMHLKIYDAYVDILGIESTGTLTEGFSDVQINRYVSSGYEYIKIAAAGTTALSGKGVLFYLKLALTASGYAALTLVNGGTDNYFNEGDPYIVHNRGGAVNIQALPVINISPDIGTIAVGDQIQYTVYSAVEPVVYWTGDTSVAVIDGSGKLTGVGPGLTKVYARDSRGVEDSTATGVRVEPFYMFFRDTSCYNGQTILIPVYIRNTMENFDIRSGQIQITVNSTYLTVLDVKSANSILDGIALSWGTDGYTLNVAFASENALTGEGVLFYLELLVDLPTDYTVYVPLTFQQILFNENFSATKSSALVQLQVVPELNITPQTASLNAGQTLLFQPSNGFPPITWSVSDTNLAFIDDSGLLTAIAGGKIRVTAIDSLGGSWVSGDIEIIDMHVYLRDTLSQAGGTLILPVYQMSYRSGLQVFSFQSGISFDTTYLRVTNVLTEGGAYDGWTISHNVEGNVLHVAGAGSYAAADTGIQYFIEFSVDSSASAQSQAGISFTDYLLNEGTPTVTTAGANIGFAQIPTVRVTMGTDSVKVDSLFEIPVLADDLTGKNVTSFEFTFSYDTSVVSVDGFNKNGTLSEGFSIAGNSVNSGQYTIAAAGTDTTTGTGTLILIRFRAKTAGKTALHWLDFMFNEGNPMAVLTDGEIVVDVGTAVGDHDERNLPGGFVLEQNYPNPFNPSTTIRYTIARPGSVELRVYNAAGQMVRQLYSGIKPAGTHSVDWDGKNDRGITLPSGVYFYRLSTPAGQAVRRMLLVK